MQREYLHLSELNDLNVGDTCYCLYEEIVKFFRATSIHLIGDGYFKVVGRGIDDNRFFPFLQLEKTDKILDDLELTKYKIYVKLDI